MKPHSTSLMRDLASELERGALCSPRSARDGQATRWYSAALDCRRFAIAPLASAVSRAWETIADPVRRTRLPIRANVVGIGGATLGGSGKTPFTLALAQALTARGSRVAVVASHYRCRLSAARRIRPDDRAQTVGDEALWLCRALSEDGVPVVCGPRRDAALELAADLAPLVIVDGLLQARPRRLALSILVLDGARPWGASRCPPAGDLRARPDRLLDAADLSVLVGQSARRAAAAITTGQSARRAAAAITTGQPARTGVAPDEAPETPGGPIERPTYRVESVMAGAQTPRGERISIDQLRSMRLGLLLGIARPERVSETLAENAIEPCATRLFADHSPMTRMVGRRSKPSPEAWLTTAKCATKLGEQLEGAAVLTLDHRLTLPDALLEQVAGLADSTGPFFRSF